MLSFLILLFALPGSIYALISFCLPDPINGPPLHAYSWSEVHDNWNNAILVPEGYGRIHWDRWIWVVYGYTVFWCFGVGEDARRAYRSWLAALGFGRCFPSLCQQAPSEIISSRPSWFGSLASKSRLFFESKGKSEGSRKTSWASGSTAFELPLIEPTASHQSKKASKWSAFVNMPGSFAQAAAGAQNLPQRPGPSASFLNSTSSAGMKRNSTLDGSSKGKSGDYV
jgi:hypothetical protein